jgi:hypothetical protein
MIAHCVLMKRFLGLMLGLVLGLSTCDLRAGQVKSPESDEKNSNQEYLPRYTELTASELVEVRTLFWKIGVCFTSGDVDGLKNCIVNYADSAETQDRIGNTLEREFKQTRYIEFSSIEVEPDEAFKDHRHAVNVRLRYKFANRKDKIATPTGSVLELKTDVDEPNPEGHWVKISIRVPMLGKYDVLLATAESQMWNAPKKLSGFDWTMDGGLAQKGPTADAQNDEEYLFLGTVDLKAGEHLFELRIRDRRAVPDTHYAFWLSALVLRRKSTIGTGTAGEDGSKTPLVFAVTSNHVECSSGWVLTPYIENCVTQTFVIQKLADGRFGVVGSEFFDSLGLRQGLGVVLVNVILASMAGCTLLVFWVWMGYEALCARPRFGRWRFVVFIPVGGALLFFCAGYLPRRLQRLKYTS